MKNPLKDWTSFEKVWLFAFTLIAAWLSYSWGDTLFSFSVFLTGVICVVLVARGSIWNYSYGTYNVIGYSWLSYKNGFFGELMLNAGYFLPMQLVGFLMWKGKSPDGVIEMRKLTWEQLVSWAIVATVLVFVYGYCLSLIPGQNSPYLDSTSTVLSVIAMILMTLRYTDQWIFWIVIDVVSVIMWALRYSSGVEGSTAMLVMWSAYLVNAVYGYYNWNKHSERPQQVKREKCIFFGKEDASCSVGVNGGYCLPVWEADDSCAKFKRWK